MRSREQTTMLGERARRGDVAGAPRPSGAVRALRLTGVAVLCVLGLAIAWVFAATSAFAFPREDAIGPADAIVVLGGLNGDPVIDEGIRLANEGYSDQVLLSTAFGWNRKAADLCASDAPYRVDCFTPDPVTTQGEARAIGELAAERGWDRVIVVTARYHVTRAEVIVARCFPGEITMDGVSFPMNIEQWAYQYLYQSAAFVKAWVNPGC